MWHSQRCPKKMCFFFFVGHIFLYTLEELFNVLIWIYSIDEGKKTLVPNKFSREEKIDKDQY